MLCQHKSNVSTVACTVTILTNGYRREEQYEPRAVIPECLQVNEGIAHPHLNKSSRGYYKC